MSLILSGTDGLSDVDGTAATPAIRGTDANTGIFFPAADTIAFSEGGTEAMRITSAGDLGLGTTSPQVQTWRAGTYLTVANASTRGQIETDAAVADSSSAALGALLFSYSTNTTNHKTVALIEANSEGATANQRGGSLNFYTKANGTASPARNMVLDSSGNLGIGTTSPAANLNVVQATSALTKNIVTIKGGGGSGSFAGLSVQGNTSDEIFTVNNLTYNVTMGTVAGSLLVGTTLSQSAKVSVLTTGGASISCAQTGTTGDQIYFRTSTSTLAGFITCPTTTTTTYNSVSDYRLKNITGALTGYKERLMSLQPKQGTWIVDDSEFRGFLAHEFAIPYTASVSGKKDAVDDDGNPIIQGMQAATSEVMADLIALVQEQQALIQSLTTRITALEQA